MTKIEYRAPMAEDAAILAAMADELSAHEGDSTGHFTAETAMADVIAPDAPLSGLIAFQSDTPVGFALWHFAYETAWGARGAYMADLYVREAARGAGIGDGLLRHVAKATHAAGGSFVWWTAYRTNVLAREFYRKRAEEEDGIIAYAAAHARFKALLEA